MTRVAKAAGIVALFGWAGVAFALLRPLLERLLGRRAQRINDRILQDWYALACRILQVRIEVRGQLSPTSLLLVSNHVSWLDIVALGSVGPMSFVAKKDLAGWPVVGYLAKQVDTLFFRRGDAAQAQMTAEQMTWRLRQGRRIVLFPEGTTTGGDRVLRFHAKLFQPAHLIGASVQAVALRYRGEGASLAPFVGDDDFVPHLWRMMGAKRIDLDIDFCDPLDAGLSPEAAARSARAQVLEALGLPGSTAGRLKAAD